MTAGRGWIALALIYLATVIVLVLLSRARTGGSTAPAALGTVFVPDR
jgi:simple sugar transport system permease protein